MLELEGISKSYNKLQVLKDIHLKISQKEVISIVGASGAGKSTLLHIMGTLDRADEGKISLNQQDISSLSENKLADFRNQNIGFIFQFHNLLPEFTALENVCIPGFIANSNEKLLRKKAKDLLHLLGLEHRLGHKPQALSGGEQQRVAIARSLINDPLIIFGDEPSGNLDSKGAENLHKLLFKLREELELTLVLVTHNPELADMADRKLEMIDGKLHNFNA